MKLVSQAKFLYFSEGRGGSPNIRPPGWWLALTPGENGLDIPATKGPKAMSPDLSACLSAEAESLANRAPISRESRSKPVSTANNRPLIGSEFSRIARTLNQALTS